MQKRLQSKLNAFLLVVLLIGVHLRQFPLKSIRQPDNAKVLTIGRNNFLITADEGLTTDFTSANDGFVWSDHDLADSLSRRIKIICLSDHFNVNLPENLMGKISLISLLTNRNLSCLTDRARIFFPSFGR